MSANQDLIWGNITASLLKFAWPFMVGNLLQQRCNIVDTLIVGRYLGSDVFPSLSFVWAFSQQSTRILHAPR